MSSSFMHCNPSSLAFPESLKDIEKIFGYTYSELERETGLSFRLELLYELISDAVIIKLSAVRGGDKDAFYRQATSKPIQAKIFVGVGPSRQRRVSGVVQGVLEDLVDQCLDAEDDIVEMARALMDMWNMPSVDRRGRRPPEHLAHLDVLMDKLIGTGRLTPAGSMLSETETSFAGFGASATSFAQRQQAALERNRQRTLNWVRRIIAG